MEDAIFAQLAKTGIHESLPLEFGKSFFVQCVAAGLEYHLPVPVQAQPAEVGHKLCGVFGAAALAVQIFNPEQPASALLPDGQPGQKCRIDVAQMHPPTGRRRESSNCFHQRDPGRPGGECAGKSAG